MTAPRAKRGRPGFSQLAIFIPTSIKNGLQQAAALEDRPQREILEEALEEYFKKRQRESSPTEPAPA